MNWYMLLSTTVAALMPQERQADSLRHALMSFAGCQAKAYSEATGFVDASRCADPRWKNQGIVITLDYKSRNGWVARATSDKLTGDCVYVVGIPRSESEFRVTRGSRRSNFFMHSPFCDGDPAADGAFSYSEFIQRSAERRLELLLTRLERNERSGKAFPLTVSELAPSDSFQFTRAIHWKKDAWAVEMTYQNFPGQSCILWSGKLDGRTIRTRMNAQAPARTPKCDTF